MNQHPINASTLPAGTAATFTRQCQCGAAVHIVDSMEQPHDHTQERIEVRTQMHINIAPIDPAELRDRVAELLHEHIDYCLYGSHDGDCEAEGCGFKAKGLGDCQAELAGHQADLLLPIIEEEVTARAAQETKMAREANRAAITNLNRAEAAEAKVAAVEAAYKEKHYDAEGNHAVYAWAIRDALDGGS